VNPRPEMAISGSILALVEQAPLVALRATKVGRARAIYAKLERFNPIGSVKDRIALAMVGAVRGYRVILTMPETMSIERRRLLRALGAESILTPGAESMRGAIREADRSAAKTRGSAVIGQFENPANPRIHRSSDGHLPCQSSGGVPHGARRIDDLVPDHDESDTPDDELSNDGAASEV